MSKKTNEYLKALFARDAVDELPSPVWGSRQHLETLWENRGDEVTFVLGTAGQALATIDECKQTFNKRPLVRSSRAEQPFCCIVDWLRDDFVVLPRDYAFLISDTQASEKYIIEVARFSGLQREIIESHDQILFALRYHGVLVSAFISVKVHVDSRERVSVA